MRSESFIRSIPFDPTPHIMPLFAEPAFPTASEREDLLLMQPNASITRLPLREHKKPIHEPCRRTQAGREAFFQHLFFRCDVSGPLAKNGVT